VPALRALRHAYPGGEIVLGVPAAYEPLASLTRAVDRVRPVSGLAAAPSDEAGMAVAVNLHGRGPQSTRLLQSLSPGRLIAFANPTVRTTAHAGARTSTRWRAGADS
jgi:hypothetical protein